MLLDTPINKVFVLRLSSQFSTSPAESLTPFCQTTHSQCTWQQGSHQCVCCLIRELPCPGMALFLPCNWVLPSTRQTQHPGTWLPSCLTDFPYSFWGGYRAPFFPIQSCLQFNLGVNQIILDRHLKDQVGRLANHSSRSKIPCQASKFV